MYSAATGTLAGENFSRIPARCRDIAGSIISHRRQLRLAAREGGSVHEEIQSGSGLV